MMMSFFKHARSVISYAALLVFITPAHANVSVDYTMGGAMRVGTSNTPCDANLTGGMRWSSTNLTIEMCDGAGTWRKIIGNITVPAVSSPDPNKGFFVLSAGDFDSNLGGLAGANTKCLDDLTNNDWNGKAEAVSRGLVNSTKVKAWLCLTGTCQDLQPDTNYQFSVSGSPNKGGATIRVASDGLTHNNTQNWSGHNYWGVAHYFTGRAVGTDTVFGGPTNHPCSSWSYAGTSGSQYAAYGISNHTTKSRWHDSTYGTCHMSLKLICTVNP